MELEDRIVAHFHQTLDVSANTIEHYSPALAEAAEMMLNCLVSESKILCVGNGSSGALASLFCTGLMNQFREERPGLPCICLSNNDSVLTGVAQENGFSEVYSRQVQAIAQPGDLLLAISSTGRDANLVQAVQAAHDRDVHVIVLSGREGGNITALLRPEEIEICVASDDEPSIHLAHTLIIHVLIDLIEHQLFGA